MKEDALIGTNPKRKKRIYEFAVLPFLSDLEDFSPSDDRAYPALRLLFALAEIARRQRDNTTAVSDKAEPFHASYNDIQKVAHIDRSEISGALQLLREREIIAYTAKRGVKTQFAFCFGQSGRWVQVPRTFFKRDSLKTLSLRYTIFAIRERHRYLLNALKLYLYILNSRRSKCNRAYIPYFAIEKNCGIRRSHIRRVLGILAAEELITIESRFKEKGSPGYKRASNAYFVLGLRDFRSLPNLTPVDGPDLYDEDHGDEDAA